MDQLSIEVATAASGVQILRLTGPLTLNTLFEFQDLARSGPGQSIIVDLSGVPYMDSAGLGAMLGVLASCQRQDRGFAVTGLSERIRTLFQVTHVDGLIPVFSTVEEAERDLAP
jgi:anti-sigma B factor antagonist